MKLIIIPLLAAVTYAASILLAKIGLTRRRISIRDYIPGLFLFLTVFSLLTLIKWGHVNYAQLTGSHNLTLLVSIIATATVWNVLFYIGLSKKKVNASEGIIILMPLMTIVLSWLFVPQNFNARIAVLALAATALVAWAYRPKKLFQLNIYTLMLTVSVVLMALENVLVGQILLTDAISPAALYFVRTLVVFVIFYVYYRPSLGKLSLRTNAFLALSGLAGASAMVLRFYGLRDAGITMTAIILILVPVIVFSWAVFFLHEKMKTGRIATMLVIGVLIIYAAVINYNLLAHK